MTKVVMNKEKFIIFETFVRDLDIFAAASETSYISLATEFIDESDAKEYIKYAEATGYDTLDYKVVDKEELQRENEETKKQEKLDVLKKQFSGLNEEGKRALVTAISPEERKLLTDALGEEITPFSDEELAERRILRLEKSLGITFTEEQKQILRQQKEV